MTTVVEIEGIGEAYAEKLSAGGVATVEALLAEGGSASGRKGIAEKTGISETLILKWVNHADLFRVNGVAGQFAELLEEAGIDTVAELAQRNPANLAAKMTEANNERNLVNRAPSESEVTAWIAAAKTLPKLVTYS